MRAYHVDFGLPANFHPDEVPATQQVARAVKAGRFFLHSYHHPPLLRQFAWVAAMAFQRLSPVEGEALATRITLIMRWISVLAGTLSVAAVFAMARRFLEPAWSLLAAALWATSPITVFQSKYATPDMLMCLLLLLGWYLALKVAEQPRLLGYAATGCVCALAIAAKYNAVFVIFSVAAAHWLAAPARRPVAARAAVALAAGVGLGMLLGFPLLISEWGDFLRTAMSEAEHQFVRGHRGIKVRGSDYGYIFHFVRSVWPATGVILLPAILLGLLHWIATGSRQKWILLAAALPYYLAMEQVLKNTFSPQRYVLPLLPIYFLAAAGAAAAVSARLGSTARARVLAGFSLATVLLMWPAYRSVRLLATMEPDTRSRAAGWLVDNVPQGASVAIGGLVSFYPPLSRREFPLLMQFGRGAPAYSVASSFDYEEAFEHPDQTRSAFEFYTAMFTSQELIFEAAPAYDSYMFHNPTIKVFRRR